MHVLFFVLSLFACADSPVPAASPDSEEVFPMAPIVARCGAVDGVPATSQTSLAEWFDRLEALPEAELRERVCRSRERQEVAVALSLLGTHWGDDAALHAAAEVYLEPVALTTAAVAHLSGTRGFEPDPARARHDRVVAGRLVALLFHGRDAMARRVAEAAGDLSLEEAGAVSLRSDPAEAAAARARLTLAEARFAELYLVAGRS